MLTPCLCPPFLPRLPASPPSSFDPQAWTAAEGGKRRAIEHIRQLHSEGAGSTSVLSQDDGSGVADARKLTIVHIGDGATDAEARDDGSGAGGADM